MMNNVEIIERFLVLILNFYMFISVLYVCEYVYSICIKIQYNDDGGNDDDGGVG